MQIELTGKEDRQAPWKFAIAGQPGSGKTLLASTAEAPLFVLFQKEPRIKSIANRSIPHIKLTNDYEENVMAVDALHALLTYLMLEDHDFKTLVIDTGDELFQVMKSGRTFEKGGEFGISDWGWISDAYREVMMAIIDMPMDIIVNFHVKTTTDDEQTFKELMLQGAAKDEAAGWFDIVAAIDVFESVDDNGIATTHRGLLTHPSRSYPWLKDHSGTLPSRYPITKDFVGDFPNLLSLVRSQDSVASHEVLTEIKPRAEKPQITTSGVPSPEDLDAKKKEIPEPLPSDGPQDTASTDDPPSDDHEGKSEGTTGEEPAPSASPPASDHLDSEPPVMPPLEKLPLADEEADAVAAVQEVLGGELIFECSKCGDPVDDADLRELTQIRFREYMCKKHFKEELSKGSK